MTLGSIRETHRATPFVPFVLHLAEGRKLRVSHPEALAIPPGEKGRTIVFFDTDSNIRLIDMLLVVEIELERNRPPRKRSA
jgi:hypothetical protein